MKEYKPSFEIKIVKTKDCLRYYVNDELDQTSDFPDYNKVVKEITNDLIDRFGNVDITIKTR